MQWFSKARHLPQIPLQDTPGQHKRAIRDCNFTFPAERGPVAVARCRDEAGSTTYPRLAQREVCSTSTKLHLVLCFLSSVALALALVVTRLADAVAARHVPRRWSAKESLRPHCTLSPLTSRVQFSSKSLISLLLVLNQIFNHGIRISTSRPRIQVPAIQHLSVFRQCSQDKDGKRRRRVSTGPDIHGPVSFSMATASPQTQPRRLPPTGHQSAGTSSCTTSRPPAKSHRPLRGPSLMVSSTHRKCQYQ